jgi:kynurenine formamidase
LSEAGVLATAQLIKTGKTYSLSIETNSKTPVFGTRTFNMIVTQPGQSEGPLPGGINYHDDLVNGWLGIGSQIDGLGHIGINNTYYNGVPESSFGKITGLTKFGVEKIPPIVTRSIVLDMAAYFGTNPVKEGTAFNRKKIEEAAERQGLTINKGDVVLFHTGWLNLLGKDDERFKTAQPGLGIEGAKYLATKGIVAVGADTWGVEVVPAETDKITFPVHRILIPINGIYILENMDSRKLVEDKVYEFMFVLGIAKMTGASQMIINPIAIR